MKSTRSVLTVPTLYDGDLILYEQGQNLALERNVSHALHLVALHHEAWGAIMLVSVPLNTVSYLWCLCAL